MSNTDAFEQRLREHTDPSREQRALARTLDPTEAAPFALSAIDTSVAAAFAPDGSPATGALLEHALGSARSLAIGTDRQRAEARVRLCARVIATLRAQAATLEIAQGTYVERGEFEKALAVGKILDGIARRTATWLSEHRMSTSGGARAVSIAVGTAENVTVAGER